MHRLSDALLQIFPILVFSAGLVACGPPLSGHFAPDAVERVGQGCAANLVVIRVIDGFMVTPCGCDEGNAGLLPSDQALVCSFPSTSSVVVDFSAARLNHQLVRDDYEQATSPYLPRSAGSSPIPTSALSFSTAGTYVFHDAYVPGSQISFIVR